MAPTPVKYFEVAIDMVQNEVRNLVLENLFVQPASPRQGQIYFNNTESTVLFWNGIKWVDVTPQLIEAGSGIIKQEEDGVITLSVDPDALGLTRDIQANIQVGGVHINDLLTKGTRFTDLFERMLKTTYYPTLTAPSFSLTHSVGNLREIGEIINFNLNFQYNPGKIFQDWDNTLQNPRSGAASLYTFFNSTNQIGSGIGSVFSVAGYIVAKGSNGFKATVTYQQGPQPKDSSGGNFDVPFAAGTSPQQSASFEGVYPLFASTSFIDTPSRQSLVSMISANNLEYTLVAETDGNKQFFDIPDAWLAARPIKSVLFFNTVSNQFDPSNQLTTFDQAAVNQAIQGASVPYTRFTNNAPNRGALKIRLVF